MTGMSTAVAEFIQSLDLTQIDDDRWRGHAPPGRRERVFGGQAVAQALSAASRSLRRGDLSVRSLHCDFLRAGDPRQPIDFVVMPTLEGRSFAARRVTAFQDEVIVLNMLVRFHADELGPVQQPQMPVGMPRPEALATYPTRLQPYKDRVPDWAAGNVPVDVRLIDDDGLPGQRMWVRAADVLPEDSVVHACAIVYASDMTLLAAAVLAFGVNWTSPGVQLASLDHAMWFHQAPRADSWLLYNQRVVGVGAGRALVTGSMFDMGGNLMVTVVQDGLVRIPEDRSRPD